MSQLKQQLKAIRFDFPDYIPMHFHINDACWEYYDQKTLFHLMKNHPFLFPKHTRPFKSRFGKFTPKYSLVAQKNNPFTDDWGCLWETTTDGITGTVTKHPLKDWADFESYTPPNPKTCMGIGPINWKAESMKVKLAKKTNGFAMGGLRHGHTFLQLCDIRGYENLMFDMFDGHPLLPKLIEQIESFNSAIISRYVDMKVDLMSYPEDLGMQIGPMVSPDLFRKYIKPVYQRMMKLARDKDIAIHMHSDGHLHALIDDIIEGGIDVINLQDLVNGVDWIAEKFSDKVCVDLDIDRQEVTMNGTPKEIDELIEYAVKRIGSKAGGLMMTYGLYPGVPLENIEALMDAMEKYAFYWSKL